MSAAPTRSLRILVLDGGGIKGYTSLLILQRIFRMLKDKAGNQLTEQPKPCDVFDLIVGTSTGGLIAVMLGRLHMTIEEAIKQYETVGEKVFGKPTYGKVGLAARGIVGRPLYNIETLQECIKDAIGTMVPVVPPDAPFCEEADPGCKVMLCVTRKRTSTPDVLRNYATNAPTEENYECQIWEATSATAAAPIYFKSVELRKRREKWVDGGLKRNNPINVAMEEVSRLQKSSFKDREIGCVVSIGTGAPQIKGVSSNLFGFLAGAVEMMTDSEDIAEQFANSSEGIRLTSANRYFRFNVPQGMQDLQLDDWRETEKMRALTASYLRKNTSGVETERCAEVLLSPDVNSQSLDGDVPSMKYAAVELSALPTNRPLYHIPLPKNKHFVGRQTILHKLNDFLFVKESQKVAIVGLGGVGKTQIALQVAYWAKENKPEYSVFWLPALSDGSFEQACAGIVEKLDIRKTADDEDPRETVRRHLSSEVAGKWLLIVDNADDMALLFGCSDKPGGINKYLQVNEDGLILFTTRSQEVAVSVAGGDVVELPEMDPQEAKRFLEESLIRKELLHDEALTMTLLDKLTYLPLAITQAAAYLNTTRVPMAEYLNLLRGADQEAASLMSREFHDSTRYEGSQNAVATTWIVSFDQIRRSDGAAADLLAFMSCIEPKAIPQSMLPRCELEEQMVYAIGTLCGYAFLTRRGDSEVFDMHSLVHLTTRIWIQREGRVATTSEAVIRQVAAVFPEDDHENRSLWREYLPHAFRVLRHCSEADMMEKYNLCYWVGRCLRVDGRLREAVQYLEEAWRWWKSHFEEDHPSRLASQHELAIAYEANGQVSAAVALLEQIVAIKAEILAKDHPSRLASQHALASAYKDYGQVPAAVALLEQVITIEARTLAEDHPDRLASQHALALAYKANGQVSAAIALLEQIVAIEAETLAEDHPDRLASQHALAITYRDNGQVLAAIALLEQIVAIKAEILAKDHPSRLVSQHALASAYRDYGQMPAAIALLKQVVAIKARTLAKDHPSRLRSQHALAYMLQTGSPE